MKQLYYFDVPCARRMSVRVCVGFHWNSIYSLILSIRRFVKICGVQQLMGECLLQYLERTVLLAERIKFASKQNVWTQIDDGEAAIGDRQIDVSIFFKLNYPKMVMGF